MPSFESFLPGAVCSTFENVATAPETLTWPEVELALHLLYLYGESNKGPPRFVLDETTRQPSLLGQMIITMVKSSMPYMPNLFLDAVQYPHVSVAPSYFENIVRYASFFVNCYPELIPHVLDAFIRHGLHNKNVRVKNRVYYLFLRFVKISREKLVEFREGILNGVSVISLLSKTARICSSFPRQTVQSQLHQPVMKVYYTYLKLWD